MLNLKSNPFSFVLLVLPLSLLFASTFFSFSHGASPFSESDERRLLGGMQEWDPNKFMGANSNGTHFTLAANRTYRIDPINGSQYYTGGWNITNKHYFASLAYSAVPPIITATVWFVAFPIFLIVLCICKCCCRKKESSYSPKAYAVSLAMLCLFTIASIIGTTILFIGQDRFHKSILGIMYYFLKEANTIMVTLEDLLECFASAKKLGVAPGALPMDLLDSVDDISTQVNQITSHINNVTTNNAYEIHVLLYPVEVALFTFAITCLVLGLLGSLSSALGLQCLVYTLVLLGWFLVVGTLVMSGIFLLFHNGVADTCQAMSEWLQNPNADSALEELLPRVDEETAESIFIVTKTLTYGIVTAINNVTLKISNLEIPENVSPENLSAEYKYMFVNQSGPLVPHLCSPLQADLSNRKCSSDEVDFDNASKVWKRYVCEVSEKGICKTQGRLTPNNYTQLSTAANVSHVLHKYGPFIIDILDSTYVKRTFTDIKEHYCPSLIKYSEWTYAGFITSSLALILSMIIWVVFAQQKHNRDENLKKSIREDKGSKSGSMPRYDEDPFDDIKRSMNRNNSGDHFGNEKGQNGFV